MATRFHCTGPIEVVVRAATFGPGPAVPVTALGGSAATLGTCKQHPVNKGESFWEEVPNDIGGSMQGLDKQFMGGTELIILNLNRFDYNVLSFLETIPSVGRFPSNSPGFTDFLARGAYKQQNALSFEMWLYYTFFGTRNAVAYPLMPPGIYYPCCSLAQGDIPEQGTKTQTKMLVIEADWAWYEPDGSFFQKSSDPRWF